MLIIKLKHVSQMSYPLPALSHRLIEINKKHFLNLIKHKQDQDPDNENQKVITPEDSLDIIN